MSNLYAATAGNDDQLTKDEVASDYNACKNNSDCTKSECSNPNVDQEGGVTANNYKLSNASQIKNNKASYTSSKKPHIVMIYYALTSLSNALDDLDASGKFSANIEEIANSLESIPGGNPETSKEAERCIHKELVKIGLGDA